MYRMFRVLEPEPTVNMVLGLLGSVSTHAVLYGTKFSHCFGLQPTSDPSNTGPYVEASHAMAHSRYNRSGCGARTFLQCRPSHQFCAIVTQIMGPCLKPSNKQETLKENHIGSALSRSFGGRPFQCLRRYRTKRK